MTTSATANSAAKQGRSTGSLTSWFCFFASSSSESLSSSSGNADSKIGSSGETSAVYCPSAALATAESEASRDKRKLKEVETPTAKRSTNTEISGNESSHAGGVPGENEVDGNKNIVGSARNNDKLVKEALDSDLSDGDTACGMVNGSSSIALKEFGAASYELDVDDSDYVDYDDDDYYDEEDVDIDDGDSHKYLDDIDNIAAQLDADKLPPGTEVSLPWLQNLSALTYDPTPSSSHTSQPILLKPESEIERKHRLFKQFDVVADYSDHHFQSGSSAKGNLERKVTKEWSKKIQTEWKLLEKDLPDSIFVRVYEQRIDLMRAVIVGASGTPYHDGLFFFDILYPSNYPAEPPKVYYHSGGLRLNPNLYGCGKVCLSLLNTWHGHKSERWNPKESNMLQVLLSIQALVLNEKPYFNEPGYERSAGQPTGEKKSQLYSQNTFILSCRTMMYTLRRPPKHFEDFVMGHFCLRAHAILSACNSYMSGDHVGFPSSGVSKVSNGDINTCSPSFKSSLAQIFRQLLIALTDSGADCQKFLERPPQLNSLQIYDAEAAKSNTLKTQSV